MAAEMIKNIILVQFNLCLQKTLYIEDINTIFLLFTADTPSNNSVLMTMTCEGSGKKGQWPVLRLRNVSTFTLTALGKVTNRSQNKWSLGRK